MRKIKLLILLPLFSLMGCINPNPNAGGGIDLVKVVQNPIVMVIIFIAALWIAFKSSGKG